MIQEKRFLVKIYNASGATLLRTLKESEVKNTPRFTSELGGGLGECVLELALPFEDFDEGVSIDYMNIVKIYAVDSNNPTGRLIYTGFISAYMPWMDGAEQGVDVTLLGLVSLLSFAYYKDGTNFTVAHVSEDPSVIMKAIIDHFNSVYSGSLLGYDSGGTTVDSVGVNVTYTFEDKKWREALEDIFGTVGGGWFWTIDKQGQLYLKEKPASATHRFTVGYDLESIKVIKSAERIVNKVQVRYAGGLSVDDDDAASISSFGTREKILTDDQIQNAGTANSAAAQQINDNKSERIKAKLVINSNYDLESIKVGDTCKILNLLAGQTVFGSNMLIVSVEYGFSQVVVELEETTRLSDEIKNLINSP